METDKEAIDRVHRTERSESANSEQEKQLAYVESAVLASSEALAQE